MNTKNTTNTHTDIVIGDLKFNLQTPIELINGQNNIDNKNIEFNSNPTMDVYYAKNDKERYEPIDEKNIIIENNPLDPYSPITTKIQTTSWICATFTTISLTISIYTYMLFPIAVIVIFSNYLVNDKDNYNICKSKDIGSNFQLYLFLFILNYLKPQKYDKTVTLNMHRVLKKYMKVLKKQIYLIDLSLITVLCLFIFGIVVLNNDCFQLQMSSNKLIYNICYMCIVHNASTIIMKIINEYFIFCSYPKYSSSQTFLIYKKGLETAYVQKKQNVSENLINENENYPSFNEWIIAI